MPLHHQKKRKIKRKEILNQEKETKNISVQAHYNNSWVQ